MPPRFAHRVGWFAAASLLCGLAPNVVVLVGARALQGIGGALLTPGSLAMIESSFRRSMLIFEGDATGFVTRPISGAILAFVVLVIAFPLIKRAFRRKTPATDTTPETVQREDSLR